MDVLSREGKHGEGLSLQSDGEAQDQLQLGVKIITNAFHNKMHTMEQEIRSLRMTSEEQRGNLAGLQKKNSALEVELVEGHQRSQQLAEENKELFKTVTNLRKQIGRLEHLKQAVMSSIQDDQEKEAELGDTRVLMSEDFLRGATPLTAAELGYGPRPALQQAPVPGAVPQASNANTYDSYGWGQPGQGHFPAQAAPAAAQATGPGSTVDGKQFFRQARSRLSYEAFNMFLASIKRLNNQQQTREETLEEARNIFGTELGDLYQQFENLLNRHGM